MSRNIRTTQRRMDFKLNEHLSSSGWINAFNDLTHNVFLHNLQMCVTRILRAVVLLQHALSTKARMVQQSFQNVLHGRVPRGIIAVNMKPQTRELVRAERGKTARTNYFTKLNVQ